jgi:hypothetical protein
VILHPAQALSVDANLSYSVAEFVLSRFNNMPVADLGMALPETVSLLSRLSELEAWKTARRVAICDRLYALGAEVDRDIRNSVLLPLRRDIYNNRKPRLALSRVPDALGDDLAAWYGVEDEVANLRSRFAALFDAKLDAERRLLQQAMSGEDFRKSVAVSTPVLAADLEKYLSVAPGSQSSSLRKSEPALLQYAGRAMMRTSPYSLYTSVALARLADLPGTQLPLPVPQVDRVAVEVNHALVRRLLDAFTQHAAVRRRIAYRLCDDWQEFDGRLRLEILLDQPDVQPRVFRGIERQNSMRLTPVLSAVIAWMQEGGSGGVMYREIAEAIASWVKGASPEAVMPFVDQLVEGGILVAAIPIPDQTIAILPAARAYAGRIGGEVGDVLCEALASLVTVYDRFGGLGPGARVEQLHSIDRSWRRCFEMVGSALASSDLLYETTAASRPISLPAAPLESSLTDLKRVLPVLEAFDRGHTLRALIREEFTRVHGFDARISLSQLRELMPEPMRRWGLSFIGAEPLETEDPTLVAIERIRGRIYREFASVTARGTEEFQLDTLLLEELVAQLPPEARTMGAAFSVFAQAEQVGGVVTRLVVNHVYNGLGAFISRFLPLLGDEATEEVRAHIRRSFPADYMVAELRPVAGFNANLHPLLAERELDVGGGSGDLKPEDLVAEIDRQVGAVVLRHRVTGQRVEVLYLGFLIPYLLPRKHGLYYSLAGSRLIDSPLHAMAEGRLSPDQLAAVRRYPRVISGSVVLARRRWYVPRECLPIAEPHESSAEYMCRVNAWRVALEMPPLVFYRTMPVVQNDQVPGEDGRLQQYFQTLGIKPRPFDFRSALHVLSLVKMIKRTDHQQVMFEETLPDPDLSAMRGPTGPHTMEMVFDLVRPRSAATA